MTAALTNRQERVLELRKDGYSFREIGEMLGVTRQCVQIIEKRATGKLGFESIDKTEHFESRVTYAAIYREYGRRVNVSQLSHVEGPRASYSALVRQNLRDAAENKIDRMLDTGGYSWDEIEELQGV